MNASQRRSKKKPSRPIRPFGCSGVARVDEMVDAEGNFICLEVNTIPGMTATSLVPKAAKAMGLSFPDLCEKILETAHLG